MILEKIRNQPTHSRLKSPIQPKKNSYSPKYRILIIQYFLFFAFLIVLVRSLELQIFQTKKLDKIAIQQYQNFKNLNTQRGKILDAKGNVLSFSLPFYSAFVLTRQIKDPYAAEKIASVLDLDTEEISNKITSNKKFVWIKKFFDKDLKKKLETLGLEGFHIIQDFKREYPLNNFASHVLGFVGFNSKGLEGLEYKYNNHLLKKKINTKDYESFTGEVYEGRNIFITIDENIQYFTQKKLEEYVKKHQALYGQAIVMESKTANILAMANYPTYNPNKYFEYNNSVYFNRAITANYEPGSTFKIITVASALEEKLIQPQQKIYCEEGSIFIGGSYIRDARAYAYLTPEETLKKSSNICALKIGRRLSRKKFHQYIKKFGFGEKTNIELPGESLGLVRDYKKWSLLDLAVTSYGHSISVTPIQLISAVNVIANDGVYLSPTIIHKIENAIKEEVSTKKKKKKESY